MKYIGENAIKKLISLIKGDLATKQPTITASGLLKGDGAGTVTAADTQEATLVDVPNGLLKGDGTTISVAVAETDYMVPPTGGTTGQILKKTETGTEWADASFKPEGKSYLTFSSPNSFTLKVNDTTKNWDGTLEYFSSNRTWTTWDGATTLSSVDNDGGYVLYLRGTGNTVITGNDQNYRWILTGSNIACIGNIENLLDYATVESGNHPTMADYCYGYMFSGCTALTQAPALPATTLATSCYQNMFYGCTALTQAPALPVTTLASYCYADMFAGCTSLTQAPALPATTLASYCYADMFQGCTSLTQAPALPATTLASYCYYYMFYGCTALTQAPALPATTLAPGCYDDMFLGCTSLVQAPALPATTLASYCYADMFSGCTALTQAPALPATTLATSCYQNMFKGCTSLIQAPALPATTLTDYCYYYMFQGCTALAQAPALPATTLANYCYRNMFQGCTSLKLSSTQTDEYTQEYRIPSSGTGTTATDALTGMFTSTGGTFTGAPEINTTYYFSSDNMIVRETEISTLNGYVGSMIKDKLDKTGDGSSVTAAFTAASSRTNIATGEKLSVLFGKIAKWFSDLGSLAFKSTVAKTDLASDVQTSLEKADSALQSVTKSDVGLGNVDNVKQYSASNPPPYPVTSVNGQTGEVTVNVPTVPSTTSLLKGNGSGGLVAATRGSDYIASGNIVKQTLVSTETTPTEDFAINWLYG